MCGVTAGRPVTVPAVNEAVWPPYCGRFWPPFCGIPPYLSIRPYSGTAAAVDVWSSLALRSSFLAMRLPRHASSSPRILPRHASSSPCIAFVVRGLMAGGVQPVWRRACGGCNRAVLWHSRKWPATRARSRSPFRRAQRGVLVCWCAGVLASWCVHIISYQSSYISSCRASTRYRKLSVRRCQS